MIFRGRMGCLVLRTVPEFSFNMTSPYFLARFCTEARFLFRWGDATEGSVMETPLSSGRIVIGPWCVQWIVPEAVSVGVCVSEGEIAVDGFVTWVG